MDDQKLKELESFSQYLYKQIEDLAQNIKADKIGYEYKLQEFTENFVALETLNKTLFIKILELKQEQEDSSTAQIPKENKNNHVDTKPANFKEEVSLLIDKYLSKEFESLENSIERRLRNEIDIKLKNNKSNSSNGNNLNILAIFLSICAVVLVFLF